MYPKLNKNCRKYSVNHTVKSKLIVFVLFYGRISAIFFFKLQKCPNLAMAFTKLVYDDHGLTYEPLTKKTEVRVYRKTSEIDGLKKKHEKKAFFQKSKNFDKRTDLHGFFLIKGLV